MRLHVRQFRIPVKPLSVNAAYRGGRRFKSKEYVRFLKDVAAAFASQKKMETIEAPIHVDYVFYVSNRNTDVFNLVKTIEDAMKEAGVYADDRQVWSGTVEKVLCAKGQDSIDIRIQTSEPRCVAGGHDEKRLLETLAPARAKAAALSYRVLIDNWCGGDACGVEKGSDVEGV
jgi:Holliday junction resolvase RusA-like endonuclease